jgi:26S proteasome regulatory subunit T4
MFAIRDDREYVNQEDLTKAARKVGEAKKHESKCLDLPCLLLTNRVRTAKMEYSM